MSNDLVLDGLKSIFGNFDFLKGANRLVNLMDAYRDALMTTVDSSEGITERSSVDLEKNTYTISYSKNISSDTERKEYICSRLNSLTKIAGWILPHNGSMVVEFDFGPDGKEKFEWNFDRWRFENDEYYFDPEDDNSYKKEQKKCERENCTCGDKKEGECISTVKDNGSGIVYSPCDETGCCDNKDEHKENITVESAEKEYQEPVCLSEKAKAEKFANDLKDRIVNGVEGDNSLTGEALEAFRKMSEDTGNMFPVYDSHDEVIGVSFYLKDLCNFSKFDIDLLYRRVEWKVFERKMCEMFGFSRCDVCMKANTIKHSRFYPCEFVECIF